MESESCATSVRLGTVGSSRSHRVCAVRVGRAGPRSSRATVSVQRGRWRGRRHRARRRMSLRGRTRVRHGARRIPRGCSAPPSRPTPTSALSCCGGRCVVHCLAGPGEQGDAFALAPRLVAVTTCGPAAVGGAWWWVVWHGDGNPAQCLAVVVGCHRVGDGVTTSLVRQPPKRSGPHQIRPGVRFEQKLAVAPDRLRRRRQLTASGSLVAQVVITVSLLVRLALFWLFGEATAP